jgi:hypothetical protein
VATDVSFGGEAVQDQIPDDRNFFVQIVGMFFVLFAAVWIPLSSISFAT